MGTRHTDLDLRSRHLHAKAKPRVFVYEAGPCGSWLSRDLRRKKGDDGRGVAPSLLPQKAGARVKTDRRDAVPWARFRRSGDRTPVSVPPWTMQPSVLGAERVKMPSALSRRRRSAPTPWCSGTISAIRARPPGARPTAGGAATASVPPRRRNLFSSRRASGHRTHRTPAASGTRAPRARPIMALAPGGARRFRPGAGCRRRWPAPRARHGATCHASSTPDRSGHTWGCSPRHRPPGNDAGRVRSPQRVLPRPAAPWGKGPGPPALPPRSVATRNAGGKTSRHRPKPSAGRHTCGGANAVAA
jgi:hypothetical protein